MWEIKRADGQGSNVATQRQGFHSRSGQYLKLQSIAAPSGNILKKYPKNWKSTSEIEHLIHTGKRSVWKKLENLWPTLTVHCCCVTVTMAAQLHPYSGVILKIQILQGWQNMQYKYNASVNMQICNITIYTWPVQVLYNCNMSKCQLGTILSMFDTLDSYWSEKSIKLHFSQVNIALLWFLKKK